MQRQESLDERNVDHNDEEHTYTATVLSGPHTRKKASFRHRYGDGAQVCVMKALAALDIKESPSERVDSRTKHA